MGKKILYIIPYYVPAFSYGGPVKIAHNRAIGLSKKGYDITVITTDVMDANSRLKKKKETIDNINITRFKNISNKLAKFQNLYLPLGAKKWIKNNIKNYDIVHIFDFYNLLTIWSAKQCIQDNIPYYIQTYGTLSDVRIGANKSKIKAFLLKKFQYIIDNAKGCVCATTEEVKEIHKISQTANTIVIPNGQETESFYKLPTQNIHKRFGFDKKNKIIVFMGRIQYIKGIDISLKILAKLNENFKDRNYIVIGPDEGEEKKLKKLANELKLEDKIYRHGLDNGDEKYEIMKGCDVFLFNSRSEGLPMTVTEAMACELPVLISPGCNYENIDDFQAGYIINNKEINKIAKKLEYMLNNKKKYIQGTKNILKEKYSLESVISQLIKNYEQK